MKITKKVRLDSEESSILRECIGFCKGPEMSWWERTSVFGDPFYYISSKELEQLTLADDRLRSAKEHEEITLTEPELMALSKAAVNYYEWLGRSSFYRFEDYPEEKVKRDLIQSTNKRLMGWRGWVPRGLWRLICRMKREE